MKSRTFFIPNQWPAAVSSSKAPLEGKKKAKYDPDEPRECLDSKTNVASF